VRGHLRGKSAPRRQLRGELVTRPAYGQLRQTDGFLECRGVTRFLPMRSDPMTTIDLDGGQASRSATRAVVPECAVSFVERCRQTLLL
jgi:hypothetical protein